MILHLGSLGLMLAVCRLCTAADDFSDHGVGAPVAENRGLVTTCTAAGENLIIACSLDMSPKGWILIINADTRETRQVQFPEGVPNSPPFASLMSANGRFYTGAGPVLLELDPGPGQWLFSGKPVKGAGCFVDRALADGPGGIIWGATHPNCHLFSFDPETKEMKDWGQLDPREQYPSSFAFDDSGWIYVGIGTARCNIVALNPASGERRQLVAEEDRALGTATVQKGRDGQVYGVANKQWYRLSEGAATKLAAGQSPAAAVSTGSISWGASTGGFPDGRRVTRFSLPDRLLEISDPKTEKPTRVEFDYESEGAEISSLVAGPDGKVYGSTNHPMHFFAYEPAADELKDLGPVPKVGGGNFCALAVQGPYIAAPAYSGGWFYVFDTRKAFNGGQGDDPNPKIVAEYPADICRPRAALAHPDGKSIVMAGFMGYGRRGGGVAIHDLTTGQNTLLTHEQVIPDQSTITLRALPDGNLVGGTSIATPGGGHPTATEGVLYTLDWATKQVVFKTVPVPGASEVFSLEVGPDNLVYGLASGSRFFVFDPAEQEVVHLEDLSAYGGLPRPALLRGPDDMIHAIFTRAIVRMEPGSFKHTKLASPPGTIGAGLAIMDGRLYFAVGSHLWSYPLPSGGAE